MSRRTRLSGPFFRGRFPAKATPSAYRITFTGTFDSLTSALTDGWRVGRPYFPTV
jgi:hypothetical protein